MPLGGLEQIHPESINDGMNTPSGSWGAFLPGVEGGADSCGSRSVTEVRRQSVRALIVLQGSCLCDNKRCDHTEIRPKLTIFHLVT